MDKKTQIKNLTVNIYELGMIRRDIETWTPYTNKEDIKNTCTSLLLITDDSECGFDYFKENGMSLEDVKSFLIKKHFDYLNKFRGELYSLL